MNNKPTILNFFNTICLLFTLFILLISCNTNSEHTDSNTYTKEENRMGTVFQITAISNDEELATQAVNDAFTEVVRIEELISSWDENSETSDINRNAGIQPVKVSSELLELIRRSKKVSNLTNGIFDISYASIDKLWKFDGSMIEIPSDKAIANSVAKINYENIVIDDIEGTIFLKEKEMKIGFGGIGKGYAANKCKALMLKAGIESGIVNAGGDLITWGKQKDGDDWTIGIADPTKKESALSYLNISDKAVVTSGNYERFVEFNGKQYCHIINPTTGWPAEQLNSVTIICADAELADALATSVFILGVKEGLELINQLKDIECFIIDEDDVLHYSDNISLNYYKENYER